ncbi:subtilisin inhibitor-like protein [Saccharomonospora glauca K62]|jgi:hypothetical protein|uniref:Subtilisin inhibitor-like protein n=2 Tax=Saccharomonospora glauca TaxID=40990 RepID=I1D0C6_9PSEU|nr:subtilisin inhibitor-like protein [Saccharomonospora glauca K62]
MFGAPFLAACTAAALCTGSPDAATPASSLVLSLTDAGGNTTSVELMCDPAQGTHPQADTACRALERADGDFTRLPAKDQACTMIHSPVLAEARGNWYDTPVDFSTEYPNACFADAQSGGVFSF